LFQWLSENFPVQKVIPVYSVKDTFDAGKIQAYEKFPWMALDTGGVTAKTGEPLYGGTGQSFDWNLVRHLNRRYLLAGGLKPENILQAIKVTNAAGFDVSSGLESSPGKKDPDKMKSLISCIRHYGKNHEDAT
jgi:phosphoribosylanthranilate isomerase